MNLTLSSHGTLSTSEEVKRSLAAMRKTLAMARKDPALSRELLVATGMHTKSGRLKKRFR